jgi:hypothetical protein
MGFSSFKSYGSRFKSNNSIGGTPNTFSNVTPAQSNLMMAVGGGAPNVNTYIITSTDNGLTWSKNTAGNQALLNKGIGNKGTSIIYVSSSNMWVAVVGSNYMYSKDNGITWTPNSSLPFNIYTIKTNGYIYIVCGYLTSGTVWYSYDLLTFTKSNSYSLMGNNAYTSLYDGSRWIVVGNGSNGKHNIITSNDGITWEYNGNETDKLVNQGFCIAYNYSNSNPIYLVGGEKNKAIIYSTDCINWIPTTNGSILTDEVYAIGWNGTNQWVAIGIAIDKTGVLMYSSDGMNWIQSISGSNFMNGFSTFVGQSLGSVSWINNSWFVGGCSTTFDIIKSTDGINWFGSDNTFNVSGYGCRSIAST